MARLAGASLAQSAARQSHNLKVVSSSLTGGTNFFLFFQIARSDVIVVFFVNYSYNSLGGNSQACPYVQIILYCSEVFALVVSILRFFIQHDHVPPWRSRQRVSLII